MISLQKSVLFFLPHNWKAASQDGRAWYIEQDLGDREEIPLCLCHGNDKAAVELSVDTVNMYYFHGLTKS